MTTNGFISEELKRKLDADESQQCGPLQKLLKRSPSTSPEQLTDIFQDQFSLNSLNFGDDEDDEFDLNGEMNDNDISDEDSSIHPQDQPDRQQPKEQEQQQPQQPAPPQRKKPGRKPNPASPALRKAQNRAAQRAFRERKERHLRELENTIKTLRENQYESIVKFQKEISQHRLLIEQLEADNYYLKEVAFSFECALNNLHGNNDATTKMKNAVSLNIPRPSGLPLNGSNGVVGSMASPFGLGIMQMRASLPSQQTVPTAQQIQNTYLGLLQPASVNGRGANLIPSPATSNVMIPNGSISIPTTTIGSTSSPPTPESIVPDSASPSSTFFAEEFAREITMADMKPFVTSNSIQISHGPSVFDNGNTNAGSIVRPSQVMSKTNSNASTGSSNDTSSVTDGSSSFMAEAATMIDNDADLYSAFIFSDDLGSLDNFELDRSNNELVLPEQKKLSKEYEQILRLSKKLRQPCLAPVHPSTKYALTEEQKYYLTVEHDARIDMIPCLHLRSRMIQHQDQYDIYELIELLINKTKCHGDPLDPDSWELPEEFFERYKVLAFQHCRIKSSLYKKYGRLPKDFDNFYRKGLHLIS